MVSTYGPEGENPELVLYKKDNVMPVFLKSIKIYLGLEKEDQKAGSKKWSESVLNLEKGNPYAIINDCIRLLKKLVHNWYIKNTKRKKTFDIYGGF